MGWPELPQQTAETPPPKAGERLASRNPWQYELDVSRVPEGSRPSQPVSIWRDVHRFLKMTFPRMYFYRCWFVCRGHIEPVDGALEKERGHHNLSISSWMLFVGGSKGITLIVNCLTGSVGSILGLKFRYGDFKFTKRNMQLI
jgi:hypothetical protein